MKDLYNISAAFPHYSTCCLPVIHSCRARLSPQKPRLFVLVLTSAIEFTTLIVAMQIGIAVGILFMQSLTSYDSQTVLPSE